METREAAKAKVERKRRRLDGRGGTKEKAKVERRQAAKGGGKKRRRLDGEGRAAEKHRSDLHLEGGCADSSHMYDHALFLRILRAEMDDASVLMVIIEGFR